MPIIPLIKPAALADVPAPVLDRQKRPTVDYSQESAAVGKLGSIKAPQMDAAAMAAPYEALGSIGRAVQQTGSLLGALAVKQKEAEVDVQVANADNSMISARGGFEQWKLDHPDPSEWAPEWEKRLSNMKQTLLSDKKLHPEAAEHIGLRLSKFAGQSSVEVGTGAAKETFARAKDAFVARIDSAIDRQDEPGFEEALTTAEQRGYIWKHEAVNSRQQFTEVGKRKAKEAKAEAERADFEAGATAAIADPTKWLEQNSKPWEGKELTWQRIKDRADAAKTERTAAVVDDVTNAIASGQLVTPAEIDAIDNKLLTPVLRDHAKRYLESRDAVAEKRDRDENGIRNAVELRHEVKAYDPASDPDRTQYFDLVKRIGSRVEQSMAGELTGELYKKYGTEPPKLKVRPEIEQNISKSLDVLFDAKQGSIPWKKEVPELDHKGRPVKDTNGNPKTNTVIDEAARQRAIDAQTRIEIKMADWYRDNPDKAQDLNAVKKHLREVLPEGTRAGVLELMQKKLGPTAATGSFGDDLVATVKSLEGFTPHAFSDFKQTSVGYGTRAKSPDEKLTETEAEARLREELSMHAGRIDTAAQKAGVRLSKGQRDALISFDFNTGQGGFLLESSGGKLDEIKRRMALYTKAGGQDLPGLVARRQKETQLFGL